MEIAIILFFLAILIGAAFLGVLIYVLSKILRRRKNVRKFVEKDVTKTEPEIL